MRLPSTTARRPRIEVIPLIDIIFFLLATFVMVSLSMVKNQGIPVVLPKAATGQPQQPPGRTATVTITEGGRLYVDREPVTFETLPRRLEALRAQDQELRVVFNGDELAYFGDVVKALDETRKVGLEKVAIQTTGARVAPPEAPES
jgi:biopolymer transport protein ExbD